MKWTEVKSVHMQGNSHIKTIRIDYSLPDWSTSLVQKKSYDLRNSRSVTICITVEKHDSADYNRTINSLPLIHIFSTGGLYPASTWNENSAAEKKGPFRSSNSTEAVFFDLTTPMLRSILTGSRAATGTKACSFLLVFWLSSYQRIGNSYCFSLLCFFLFSLLTSAHFIRSVPIAATKIHHSHRQCVVLHISTQNAHYKHCGYARSIRARESEPAFVRLNKE